jgi:dTDP-4-amino-4,6-dideoxygalactose transaminase
MEVLRKVMAAALLLVIAGGAAFAITDAEVKQEAQSTLQQAKQQAAQNDSDYENRTISSEGNTSNAKFSLLKHRIDAQATVVEREKGRIDTILQSGRTARPEELNRYEKAIAEYARRVKELEEWLSSN